LSDTGNDNEELSDTGNDNEESSDTGDDSRGPFMNRPGFEYFSENDSYGDFGVRLGFTEPVTSDKSEPRHEFTEQPINPANPKKPVIKVSETDSCPEIIPKPDRAYPGHPSPKETQQPPLLTWEEQPLRKSSLDTPLIPHPHPSPRQETGARRAPIRFPTPASDAGSERSTARITRPKRKVAELDNDALGDTERKGRGRGTRDDPIAVDR